MSTKSTSAKDASDEAPANETETAAAAQEGTTATEPVEAPQDQNAPAPGVYEYVHPTECVYPHVPLTARPAAPARQATDDGPGAEAIPATVYEWLSGPPADGRWTKTRKKPNQAADNAGPLISEE
ncbi:hypothetical protein [Streptomyces sp. NPDC019937]|uniref:hypothetical protein n=1 Tax=Streptomyces sp. NPDC019937 TaxID=3154787 RepID=UPI00340F4850